jgi:glycerol-3-phosphate acyltransferase PlsY
MMWLLLILGAYVLGSIPFGVLIARSRGVDITKHGSGNIGATNVGRVLGKRLGLLCFVLDLGKGAVPVLVAGRISGTLGKWSVDIPAETSWLWLAVAVAALTGHMASVFLKFRGGKGVATTFGALLALWPTLGIPALLAFAVWVVAVRLTKIVSLASMIAAVVVPWATLGLLIAAPLPDDLSTGSLTARMIPPMIVSIGIAALVLWRHRSNFRRLLSGTENRIGG